MGRTYKSNRPTGTADSDRHLDGFFGSHHTLQDRVCASLRHLKHLLDSLVPFAGDDVGGPKLARQSQALGLMAQHNDLLRAQAAGRQRGAQAHRPIADDRHASARPDVGAYRCVMARRHDIGQGQNGLEQSLISFHLGGYNDQGGIGKARPNSLGLPAFVSKAPETTLHTGAIESLEADEILPSKSLIDKSNCCAKNSHCNRPSVRNGKIYVCTAKSDEPGKFTAL
jgi:hypothetical protein